MRPLTLTMTAFGPFPETETIRFLDLGENPLFLINGPTGSGKTTILDAICFALYGKTTGDEREGTQMRCDLASADILTEVCLDFEFSGRRFSIRRVPEQQRPKARGEGTTTQAPEAQLIERLSEGKENLIVASKVSEATREIEELTGLSVEQFRQVMVLPQGQFRQLLMADSNEREKIFSNLFQTRIYKRLEESLKARSAEIRRERDELKNVRKGILEGAELESAEELEGELAERLTETEAARLLKEEQEKAFGAANRAQQQALGLEQAFAELERLTTRQAELQAQQKGYTDQRGRLAAAEEALKLKPRFDEKIRRQTELQQAETGYAQATAARDKAQEQLTQADQERQAAELLAAPLDEAKQEVIRLEGLRTRVSALATARQALGLAESAAKTIQLSRQKAEAALLETQNKREAAEQKQALWQEQLSALGDAQLQQKVLTDQLASRQELDSLQRQHSQHLAELERAEAQGKRLRDELEVQEKQAKGLELAWHQGQAAILAAELLEGHPCPVCGSTAHPAPAHSKKPLPSQDELEAARTRAQEISQRLAAAREAYGETRGKVVNSQKLLGELQAKLGEAAQRSTTELRENHDRLKREVETLLARRKELAALTDTLQQLKQAEAGARQSLDQAGSQMADSASALATTKAQVQSAEKELPEAYRAAGSLDKAIVRAQNEVGALEQRISAARENHKQAHGLLEASGATLIAAEKTRHSAQTALAEALAQQEAALAASSLADESAYRNALLEESQATALRQAISDYDQQCQRISGALEQQRTAVQDQSRPDLERVATELHQAEAAKIEADSRWQQLDGRRQILETTRKKLQKAAAQQTELDRRYAVIGTLSDVANGQTGNKISLQRFVLSVLLDDVLIEASHRLSLMSKGRYQLLRKEDRAKGNKASGLELEVEDAYTGKVRPVATLSGGESFMAALSMALGLSDVVQAYAGGIHLDTLFIDEGFGSLDAESLDLAIRTLIDLQATGRMIGIISHVAELKEQMPLRLDVISDRNGSKVRLVRP